MTTRPRMLFVSPRFLFPMNEGGKIRTANTLRHLKGGAFDLTLATPVPPDATSFADETALVCDRLVSWPATPPTRLGRLLALAAPIPVGVATDRSAAGQAAVARVLAEERPDVVVIDFPHATVLAPARMDAATVMFTHNVEAEIFQRHAVHATGVMRPVWRSQARKMERFERRALLPFDSVIAVSARDGAALTKRYGLATVETVDTGVDLDYFAQRPAPDHADGRADTIVFSGVMDSPANIDGIAYFMDDIWPLVARARPDAKVLVVGRRPQPAMIETARTRGLPWTFTGSVPDIRPHLAQGDVAVIPLRIGSGTRIKAFEMMALGRPVVSTTVGVEGLDIAPGTHFIAADDPAARARVEERFSWATIGRQFEAICLRALERRVAGRAGRV